MERSPGSCGAPGSICGKKSSWFKRKLRGLKQQVLRANCGAQDFSCGLSDGLRLCPQNRSKCNEALSKDLWPLDPYESAPMRATSSVFSYCIPHAILAL